MGQAGLTGGAEVQVAARERSARLIDQVSLYVLCVGGFAIPIIYVRNTYDEFVLPKLLFAHVLVLFLIAAIAVRWAMGGAVAIRRSQLDLPVLAFLGSALLSTVFSVNQNDSVFGTYIRYEGLLTLGTYVGLFWVARQIAWRANDVRMLLRSILFSAYVVALIAMVQWVIAALTTTPPSEITGFSYGGLPRASATMSNPTMLGVLLAMLLPVAVSEFFEARSWTGRVFNANVALTLSLALALTFVRSAWLGALAGVIVAVAAPQRVRPMERLAFTGAGIAVVVALLAASAIARGGLPLVPWLMTRAASIEINLTQPAPSSASVRFRIWEGTIPLIASRPAVGYGPDTFGLVYPRFRTGDWTPGFITDKSPNDFLQIGSTQGLLGVAAYLWLLGAALVAFWRGRRNRGSAGALGGLLAYQVWAQANFSWVPAELTYWLLLAASVGIWTSESPGAWVLRVPRLPGLGIASAVAVLLIGLGIFNSAREWSADALYAAALRAEALGDVSGARSDIAQARTMAPEQSLYAMEAGRLDMKSSDPEPMRWIEAREAFSAAARLGTYYSLAYYNLALCDLHLNRRADAIADLHRALELSPGDPASISLLSQIELS